MTVIRSRVDVRTDFGKITEGAARLAREGVLAGATAGAREAGRIAAQRRVTGKLSTMEVLPPRRTHGGWEASFRSQAYYRLWHDLGTLRNRSGAVSEATKRRRRSGTGAARFAKVADRPGIEPLFFFRAGRREGTRAMKATIQRGIR